MTTFSAAPQALGYLYQARVALLLLLQSPDEAILRIEALDDIELTGVTAPDQLSLIQLKHHTKEADLSDYSEDLWKSIRVWSEQAADAAFVLEDVRIALVTTAKAKPDSVAAKLGRTKRDPAGAEAVLMHVANTSGNKKLKPAFEAFLKLDAAQRKLLLAAIYVIPQHPDIDSTGDAIRQKLRPSVRAQFVDAFAERVEGWWGSVVIRHLLNRNAINAFELHEKVAAIAEGFHAESLPIDFLQYEPDAESQSVGAAKQFVRQLQAIGLRSRTIEKAISDYYRAYHQRHRWLNEGLVFAGEIMEYERLLVDEWERFFDLNCSDLEDDEQQLISAGRKVLEWAELHCDVRIRPRVSADYVRRGTFHWLADREPIPPIHWHPLFVERLAATMTAAAEGTA